MNFQYLGVRYWHYLFRYLNVLFGCSSCDGSGAVLRVKSSGPEVVTGASGSWPGKVTGIGAGGSPGTSCVKKEFVKSCLKSILCAIE